MLSFLFCKVFRRLYRLHCVYIGHGSKVNHEIKSLCSARQSKGLTRRVGGMGQKWFRGCRPLTTLKSVGLHRVLTRCQAGYWALGFIDEQADISLPYGCSQCCESQLQCGVLSGMKREGRGTGEAQTRRLIHSQGSGKRGSRRKGLEG